MSDYETILYRESGPVGWITLNLPERGNMFNATMLRELRDVLERTRLETASRVLVLTGAGDRFFCLGGDKEGLESRHRGSCAADLARTEGLARSPSREPWTDCLDHE